MKSKKILNILLVVFLLIEIVGMYDFTSNAATQKISETTITVKTGSKSKITAKKKVKSATYLKAIKEYKHILTRWKPSKFMVGNFFGDSTPELIYSYYDSNLKKNQIRICQYNPSYTAEPGDVYLGDHMFFLDGDCIYINKKKKVLIGYDKDTSSIEAYNVFDFKGNYKYSYHRTKRGYSKYRNSNWTSISISKKTYNKDVNSYLKGAKKFTPKSVKYKNNASNRKKYLK